MHFCDANEHDQAGNAEEQDEENHEAKRLAEGKTICRDFKNLFLQVVCLDLPQCFFYRYNFIKSKPAFGLFIANKPAKWV